MISAWFDGEGILGIMQVRQVTFTQILDFLKPSARRQDQRMFCAGTLEDVFRRFSKQTKMLNLFRTVTKLCNLQILANI